MEFFLCVTLCNFFFSYTELHREDTENHRGFLTLAHSLVFFASSVIRKLPQTAWD
jgi:hypothetical protein